MIKHLPELPLPGFDADKVNLSGSAYLWGAPDGAMAVMGCALNLPIATYGGRERAQRQPLLPLLAAAKGTIDAAIAVWYLRRMALRQKLWCSYCIVAAIVDLLVFALTLPEARRALNRLRGS